MNKTIKINDWIKIPKNFTGVAEHLISGINYWFKEGNLHRDNGPAIEYINGNKEWWVEGLRHRIDGPAVEYSNREKYWYVEDICYSIYKLQSLIQTSIYLGKKQNGDYNLDWLRFLTDQGIKEFPIVPGMEKSYLPFLLASLD